MKKGINKFSRVALTITLIFVLSLIFYQQALGKSDKKVIIFVVDKVNWQDILSYKYPNLKKFTQNNGIGLMNTRSKNMFYAKNLESSYLSMNMGIRVNAPNDSGMVIRKGTGLRVADFNIIKQEMKNSSEDKLGLLGRTAAKRGLKIGLISSELNKTKKLPVALLAMDDEGNIPFVATKLNDADKVIDQADIIFVDLKSLTDIDQFILQLKASLIYKSAMVMLISPNPSPTMEKQFNFSLTPYVIKIGSDKSGLVYSKTTKRDGLVTNFDLAPTILNFFHFKEQSFMGEPINILPVENNTKTMLRNENLIINLEKLRFLIHGLYIFLSFLIIRAMFLARKNTTYNKNWVKLISLSLLEFPLLTVLLPILTGTFIYGLSWRTYLIVILLTTFVVSYLTLRIKNVDMLSKIGLISGATTIVYMYESYTGFEHLLNSPFGYNDLMIAGRFYGINNDAMSIYIAAAIVTLFIWLEKTKPKSWLALSVPVIFGGLILISFGAIFGANVGGSITAMSTLVFAIILIAGKRLTFKGFVLILILVFLLQVGLAFMDASFNPPLTHAGKAIQTISKLGWIGFLDILTSKTYQLFLMIIIPPWNILLFYQVYILYKIRTTTNKLSYLQPYLNKGFTTLVLSSIIGFAFNDTGVTVASIMLTYLFVMMISSRLTGQNNR